MNESSKVPVKALARRRSDCPVSCALDLLGDKWTLLLVRDLLLGKGTYSEFQSSAEGMPTNILADRLKRLQAAGVIDRAAYQDRPVRYRYALTAKGRDLAPVISAMIDWGSRHVENNISRAQIERMLAGQ